MTKTIPYNTYGTVTTRASVTIPASNVPYTYSPLKSDLYIASDLTDVAPKPVITSMALYAQNNIPNYNTITEIPSGHLPENLNTSSAEDWGSAFYSCNNVLEFPDPFYDTSSATEMDWMFTGCKNITTVPNFDTSKVTNMRAMFRDCSNLTTVPNFDTSNVSDISGMFTACSNLVTAPNFDTSSVYTMRTMFSRCSKLTYESFPNPFYNTSNVVNMGSMFYYCSNLITVPNFNTSNVTDMSDMFNSCKNLVTVPNFNTSNVTNMYHMFYYCERLTSVPNFNTGNVNNMYQMFYNCCDLTTIHAFDTSNVTNMGYMFNGCTNIHGDLYIESNNVANAKNLFYGAYTYIKNIYCHANSTTYNSIYAAMGNNTYNSDWYTYLLTMEDNYTEIVNIANINSEDSVNVRFPSNKIEISYVDNNNKPGAAVVEVLPYTDYRINFMSTSIFFERYVNSPFGDYETTISLSPLTPGFESLLGGGIVSVNIRCFKDILTKTPVASENI